MYKQTRIQLTFEYHFMEGGPCQEMHCQNEGKCEADPSSQSSTCICPIGFNDAKCESSQYKMAKLFSHKCDSFTQKEIAIYKLFHSDLFSDVNVLPTAPGPTPVSFMLHFFSFKSLLLHDLFLLFILIYIKQPSI